MNVALSVEPQVAIARALMQKYNNAILIPQSIRVDLVLMDIVAETSQYPLQVGERIVLGSVFELNRQTAIDLVGENGDLPAATLRFSNYAPFGFVPCLTTTIHVFEETITADYETQISHPIPLQQNSNSLLVP